MSDSRCVTGKVCFPTSAAARYVTLQRGDAAKANRVYRCPICGHWHMTKHRPPYRRKRRRGQGGEA